VSRRNYRHECIDHDCPCQDAAIAARELEADYPEPYDDQGGQDQYERYLDRLGGVA
jgi:hypothetical protein